MKKKTRKFPQHNPDIDFFLPCLQIGKLLTSTLDLNEILSLIMNKISLIAKADNWSLLLLDEKQQELHFEVAVGIDKKLVEDIHIPLGKGIAGEVAKTGKPIYIDDAEDDPRIFREVDNRTGFVTRSIICFPLQTHGRILGVIEMVNLADPVAFIEKKLPLLAILADYAAIAIENSQYTAKIQSLSITDEYTGLYNARYMHQILPELLKDSQKKAKPLSLAFVDIDNFKSVVDLHGHLAGSQVLKEIGQVINRSLGKEDLLTKYGGDEFVIVMPGRDKKQARKLAETILKNIRDLHYLKEEKNPVQITASFGLATYPGDANSVKDLLLRADAAMYDIKRSTKNAVGGTEE
jgi:diguanylate cyclase (GGDEF)-like protein